MGHDQASIFFIIKLKWLGGSCLWVYKFEIFLGGSQDLFATTLRRARLKSKKKKLAKSL